MSLKNLEIELAYATARLDEELPTAHHEDPYILKLFSLIKAINRAITIKKQGNKE